MSLISEYEEVLIGNQETVPKKYFVYDGVANERLALSVFRYAIEYLMGWTPEEALNLFNVQFIKLLHLDQFVKYIRLPSDVTIEDTEYIIHLLYPKKIPYDIAKYAIRVYENVLQDKQRYPKDYMYGYIGLIRARICLRHALNQGGLYNSIEELYAFFGSRKCIKFLKDKKLYQLYTSFFDTPIEYLHASLPESKRNDFLFHNYLFLYLYNQLATKKPAEKTKKQQGKTKKKTG